MSMNDRLHVLSQPVDRDVHRDLAGALTLALHLGSCQIANNQVVRFNLALADSGRRAENAVLIQPDTYVSVIHGDPTLFVDQAANSNEIRAIFLLSLAHEFPQILSGWGMSHRYNGAVEKRRMCPNCRAFISTSDRVCPYCEAQVGPRAIDLRGAQTGLSSMPRANMTSIIILAINITFFVLELIVNHQRYQGPFDTLF